MEAMLARELKSWQRDFRSKNGREPTKRDMAEHPDIASTYATWTAMREESKSSGSKAKGKKKRTVEEEGEERGTAAAPPTTPAKRRAMPPPPQASPSTILRTPSQRAPAMPGTPSSAVAGGSRNPFKTPLKPTRAPQAPSTGRSLIASSSMALLTPTTPARLAQSGEFDDATSPSKLRSLLQSSGGLRTPNTRAALRALERTRTEEALALAYTPRTKARKRLRGEEVPPTPDRAAKRASRGKSGAAFGAAGEEVGGGAWGRKALEGLEEEDAQMNGVSPLKPDAPTAGKQAAAEPALPKFVPLLPGPSGSAGGDESDSDSLDSGSEGEAMLQPGPSRSQAQDAGDADWAMDLDAAEAEAEAEAEPASPPSPTSPTKRKAQWIIRTAVVSEDDEDEPSSAAPRARGKGKNAALSAPKKSTTITVRPYQRYGSLRVVDSADGDAEDESRATTAGFASPSSADEAAPSSSRLPLRAHNKAATLASPPPSHTRNGTGREETKHTSSPEAADDATSHLRSLRIASSPQTKGARAHARALKAAHIAHLLGGEAEELELEPPPEAEQGGAGTGSGLAKAKNWGTAKGREAAGNPNAKAKGKGRKKDNPPPPPAVVEPPKPPRTYDRAGRSGMASDEVPRARAPRLKPSGFTAGAEGLEEEEASGAEPREDASEDEDWHSEVSSAEYGLGDGMMDDMDVI